MLNIQYCHVAVPWGKVAVKIWGPEESNPVLVIHGMLDNAASFDNLIPYLPKFCYICIDLPGHGRSSHFPSGLPIFTINYLIVYKLVLDHFNIKRCPIMGHSHGGQIGLLFAQIYPERVDRLILLDTIHLLPVEEFKNYLRQRLEKFFEFEYKKKPLAAPKYTYNEVLRKLIVERELDRKAAKNLMERTLIPTETNKFYLSHDQRLKFSIDPLQDVRYIINSLEFDPVQCPVIFVLATKDKRGNVDKILDYFKSKNNMRVEFVEGTHDVHQNHPERVAEFVSEFLVNKVSKL